MNAGRNPSQPEDPGRGPVLTTPTDAYRAPNEGPGTRIGPYKLLQQIGEGGFGIVYMAEQVKPVHRRVALKIIKPGMDSAQVIARFEVERQALAMMDHQNIAKVFDAGTTDNGRPYFVMELVHGVPMTKYCDDNHLTVRERLELFVPVCKAIQHAHQKGIIHRDIKPSNVLVCLYDGQPVPKVIDFGVAKATEQRLAERTMFTQYGQIIGTLEYMSPEQAEMSQLGVDTRSDIYSLGVMLYELLTGSTPLQRQRLRAAGLAEMLKMVKEEEPPKPSTRLSSTQEVAQIARARRTEPVQLAKLLRGELDWVVMKCLEKDRTRRYDTATGPARDIERYLHDEPVEAGPPGTGYRLRKLARKHRTALCIAGLFMGLLVLAVAVSTWQAVRATRAEGQALAERDRAEQEKERAQASFRTARDTIDHFFTQVGDSPQLQAKGMENFRKDLLQNAKEFYERFIREQFDVPEVRHDLAMAHLRLAKIQVALGDYREAEALLTKAVAMLQELNQEQPDVADNQRDLAAGYAAMGRLYTDTGRLDQADAAYQQALALQNRLVAAHPESAPYRHTLAAIHFGSGNVRGAAGQREQAIASYEKAETIQRRLIQEQPRVAEYQFALARTEAASGSAYELSGNTQKGIVALMEALSVLERLLRDHPDDPEYQQALGFTLMRLGGAHHSRGQDEPAEAYHQRALQVHEKLAREHPDVPDYARLVGSSSISLAIVATARGNPEVALASIDRAIAAMERWLQIEPRHLGARAQLKDAHILRAVVLAMQGNHAQAIQEAEAVAAQEGLGEGNLYNLACLYSRCAAAAGKDEKLPSAERSKLQEHHAVRAVDYLRQAVARGYRNRTMIKSDPDLEALREREDFKKLLQEMEEKMKK